MLSRFRLFKCLWMIWVHTYTDEIKKKKLFWKRQRLVQCERQSSWATSLSCSASFLLHITIHLSDPSWLGNRGWFTQVLLFLFNFIPATFKGNRFIPIWSRSHTIWLFCLSWTDDFSGGMSNISNELHYFKCKMYL